MKKMSTVVILTLISLTAAGATFQLFNEYRHRDQIKMTPAQANVLNFLVQLEFSTQKLVEVEAIGSSTFLVRSRTGTICAGDIDNAWISCKNELGLPGMVYPDAATVSGLGQKLQSTSKLAKEFQRRESLVLSPETQAILDFLKLNNYSADDITELELMDPPSSFVIRNRNGDICLGEITEALLRCKNEIGITGVTFQGDSD